jgi:uncharacterized protein (TIGR02757 family)
MNLKNRLDIEVSSRDCNSELCISTKPDPIIIAKRYNDEYISLICALFAYGNVRLIVKFLDSLDFDLLNKSDDNIKSSLTNHYYRFQNSDDVIAIFIALKRLKNQFSLNELFLQGYKNSNSVLDGIEFLIKSILKVYDYRSRGYDFLIGRVFKRDKNNQISYNKNSAYKRWNMYLRWMVRYDSIDMGLWSGVNKSDLILPLDVHTFNVSKSLGLLDTNSANLQSAISITSKLKQFDKYDPIKYDFALYRIGQEKLI